MAKSFCEQGPKMKRPLSGFVSRQPLRAVHLRDSAFSILSPIFRACQQDFGDILGRGAGCPACKRKGWMEILGCGMVDPNVFEAVGYDPEEVAGFAFGMGIDRQAMLKYAIHDIRLFFENDVRFLRQF